MKAILIAMALSVVFFASCAITGINICNKETLGKYRCNAVTCTVTQCQEKEGQFAFDEIAFDCIDVNSCQCEVGVVCKKYKCVQCSEDGFSYDCQSSKQCDSVINFEAMSSSFPE